MFTGYSNLYSYANAVALQRDGKIVVAGSASVTGDSRLILSRFLADGRPDFTFNSTGMATAPMINGNSLGYAGLAIQRNGKLVVTGQLRNNASGEGIPVVVRYLANGTPDPLFGTGGSLVLPLEAQRGVCRGIVVQRDGKIAVSGYKQPPSECAPFLARLAGDPLNGPVLQVEQPVAVPLAGGSIHDLGAAVTGGVLSRQFTIYNPGTEPLAIAGLQMDGPDATAFQVTQMPAAQVPPDASSTFTVRFAPGTGGAKSAQLRVSSNDPAPVSYVLNLTATAVPTPDPDIVVEQPPGTPLPAAANRDVGTTKVGVSVSLTFQIRNAGISALSGMGHSLSGSDAAMFSVTNFPNTPLGQEEAAVFTVRFLPTLIGLKSAVLRITSNDPDENPFEINLSGNGFIIPGEPDPSFSPVSTNGSINSMIVQPDGRILIGGSFTTVNGQARSRMARLLPNGVLDASFNYSAPGAVNSMAMQIDGRCVIGGAFGLARLNGDGTPDAGFQSSMTTNVSSLGLGLENKIIFLDGISIKRALSDGRPDAGFTAYPSSAGDLAVLASGGFVGLMPDLFSGAVITTYGPDGRSINEYRYSGGGGHPSTMFYSGLTSVLGEGNYCGWYGGYYSTRGDGFSSSPGYPGQTSSEQMVGQADGKVIFSSGVRIKADGTTDTGFAPAGASLMAIQGDGRLLLSSTMSSVGTVTRRLNDPVIQSLTATDARRVQWLRGGAAPVSVAAQFEVSTDGRVNWILLGPGTQIPGGWELTGLNLPGSGKLRARARTASFRSYGLVETVADFTVSPTIPRLVVLENGGELTSGSAVAVDFGRIGIGESASRTITLRNTGWGDLTDIAVTL